MTKFYLKAFKGMFIFLLGVGFSFVAKAQYPCVNLDFSSGTFKNWTGYTSCYPFNTPGTNITNPANGITPPASYYFTQGIVPGRHTIITTSVPDPYTCGNVMTLPPGEKQCVRLGNGGNGSWGNGVAWQREFLTYDFSPSVGNALLIYKYAVVLQDTLPETGSFNNHTKNLRPRFIASITNMQDKVLNDSICYYNEVFADSTLKFLHACNLDSAKKNWVLIL